MKKILFTAYTLDIGGIETALVNLLNELVKKYEVTLVLEKKQGIFLERLDSRIKIIEYNPNQNKNPLVRKSINLMKRIKFIAKYKNKYDFAASFATYSKMGSFCARTASKNNALWMHSDYLALYQNDENKVKKFFEFVEYEKFKNLVCIANKAKASFEKVFGHKENIYVINNLMDYEKIIKESKEKIDFERDNGNTIFLNVARHEEESKKLTRLITATEMLKEDKENFKIILVGDGKDSGKYKAMVKEKGLSDYIVFVGYKRNPYPYFKIADAFILTSEFEGYPVVFNEAKTLGLPIITTDVSDAKIDIDGRFGIVTNKDVNSIYAAMKKVIKKDVLIEQEFNPKDFNQEIINKIESLISGGNNAKN